MDAQSRETTATTQTASAAAAAMTSHLSVVHSIRERGWEKLKSLDGESRLYTLTVLTTLAFTIATVYFDIGFLETDKDEEVLLEHAMSLHTLSAAGRQIVRALLLLLLCLLIATYSFFLLGINVYPFDSNELNRHRLWLALSFLSACVSNGLVVITMVTSQLKYNDRKEKENNYESGFSHYLLFTVLFLSTVAMDFYFLVAFSASYQKLLVNESEEVKETRGWGRLRNIGLPSIIRRGGHSKTDRALLPQPSMRTRIFDPVMQSFVWMLKKTLSAMNEIVRAVRWLLGVEQQEAHDSPVLSIKHATEEVSDVFLDIADNIWESSLFRALYRMASFLTWGIWKPSRSWVSRMRETGEYDEQTMRERATRQMAQFSYDTVQYWRTFGCRFRSGVDDLYDDIREDDQYQHSSWVLAAMCTSFVLLIYFGVALAVRVSGFINEMYIPRRNCAVWSIERNGELGNFIFRMAGFTEGSLDTGDAFSALDEEALTEAACAIELGPNVPSAIQGGQNLDPASVTGIVQDQAGTQTSVDPSAANLDVSPILEAGTAGTAFLEDGRYFRCSSESYSENSCTTLVLINRLEQNMNVTLNESKSPTQVFRDHAIGRTIYVMDRLVHHLRWSIWIGLMAGLVVGIYSLLSVLAQYKRFSLAIRSGFFVDLHMSENLAILNADLKNANIQRIQSIVVERKWQKLVELYPMGASVFFFGILVSTAVIQLAVFGAVVSFLLSLVISIFDHRVFVILRPFLAFLIAFLVTWLLNGPLAQMVISEGILVQKYRVFHELCFLFFLLVYTAVHLVLGVFFALMRLVWVLLTTIACLNRLDQNLFPILKRNDLGHKSFMSMVLMQHAFLANADAGERFLFADLLARVRESQQRKPPSDTPPETPTLRATAEAAMQEQRAKAEGETIESAVSYLHDGFDDDSPGGGPSEPPNTRLPVV